MNAERAYSLLNWEMVLKVVTDLYQQRGEAFWKRGKGNKTSD